VAPGSTLGEIAPGDDGACNCCAAYGVARRGRESRKTVLPEAWRSRAERLPTTRLRCSVSRGVVKLFGDRPLGAGRGQDPSSPANVHHMRNSSLLWRNHRARSQRRRCSACQLLLGDVRVGRQSASRNSWRITAVASRLMPGSISVNKAPPWVERLPVDGNCPFAGGARRNARVQPAARGVTPAQRVGSNLMLRQRGADRLCQGVERRH
jgi:hypothetical protein